MLATASLAAFATDLGHMGAVTGDGFATFATDLSHVFAILTDAFAAFSPNFGHMLAILADDFTTLFSGHSRFVGREFVSCTFFMGSSTSLARNGALFVPLHGREAPLRCRFAVRRRLGVGRRRLGSHFFSRFFSRFGLRFLYEQLFIADRKRFFVGLLGVVRVFNSFLALMVNHETPPLATLLETRQCRIGLADCCCADRNDVKQRSVRPNIHV
jgi:hypothetical protein